MDFSWCYVSCHYNWDVCLSVEFAYCHWLHPHSSCHRRSSPQHLRTRIIMIIIITVLLLLWPSRCSIHSRWQHKAFVALKNLLWSCLFYSHSDNLLILWDMWPFYLKRHLYIRPDLLVQSNRFLVGVVSWVDLVIC